MPQASRRQAVMSVSGDPSWLLQPTPVARRVQGGPKTEPGRSRPASGAAVAALIFYTESFGNAALTPPALPATVMNAWAASVAQAEPANRAHAHGSD